MTQFFQAIGGCYYPVSKIVEIRPGELDAERGVSKPARVEMENGEVVTIYRHEADNIAVIGIPITPANPGFEQLIFWFHPEYEDEEYHVQVTPVIGWRETPDEGLVAVTLEENIGVNAPIAILLPDGQVHTYDCRWPDRASWEKSILKEEREKRAKAEAAK